jgi:phosphoribosylformimino-5-aminoimidazole carboxamide ribotide isomerase
MRIIPAIDILGGKCVRLLRGDYSAKTVYSEDPLSVAMELEDNGLRYLHLVDLDGAREKKVINHRILEKIASKTGLEIDFGGGIRSDDDLSVAFGSGAARITAGSIAVSSPETVDNWIKKFGNEKVMLGADSKDRKIAVNGWQEKTDVDVVTFISVYCNKGMKYAVCTDVNKDGLMEGPSLELYREILTMVSGIKLIASGGIASLDDVNLLRDAGCEGAIIGKAIYEGKIKLKELRDLC